MSLLERARPPRPLFTRSRLALAVVAVAAVVGGAALRANIAMPLPVFDLSALDGTRVQSSELPGAGKWLIVYVQPNCRPCDRLLRLVKREEHPALAAKMVIIVGGADRSAAADLRAKLPDLADAQWFADDARKAWTSLKMTGVPTVLGVRARMVEWTLSGVQPSDAQVTSILASWGNE